jgi:hypothetical protein
MDETIAVPATIVVGTDNWARAAEVLAYAQRRGIDADQAIRELVNMALSVL